MTLARGGYHWKGVYVIKNDVIVITSETLVALSFDSFTTNPKPKGQPPPLPAQAKLIPGPTISRAT
jgi:hypothetical protein